MSQELERVYTIPLGKVLLSANTHRAVRAINMIKEFARRHMKTYNVKIDEEISHIIWARGVRSPPRKIRVKMTKTDEGYILVSPYEDEIESDATPEKESTPKVTEDIEPEKSGMELTESGQIVPEQSTAAIVVHHPDAEYFVL